MALIEENGRPLMAALQIPPHARTLTDASDEGLEIVI